MAWSHEQGTGCLLRLICFGSRIPLKSEQVWKIFNGPDSARASAHPHLGKIRHDGCQVAEVSGTAVGDIERILRKA